MARSAPAEYVRPDWADAALADVEQAVGAARANAARHNANYVSPYSVREPDGSVRGLTQVELREMLAAGVETEIEVYLREGCCGQRGPRGDCLSQAVASRRRCELSNRGMGTRSLSRVGGLCPLSEWWLAYDVTRDASAVAEARFSGELAE